MKGTIICQGTRGSYSQIAAVKIFGDNAAIDYAPDFKDVFEAVVNGKHCYGVLPVHNSTAGPVRKVNALMAQYSVTVKSEYRLKIQHALLVKKGFSASFGLKNISRILSHEQAISQCSNFLDNNQRIEVFQCKNTAFASKIVAECGFNDIAAISSIECSNLYGLDILLENIQNEADNYTNFICITK